MLKVAVSVDISLEERRESLAKRQVPCLVTYLSPFRILTEDSDWNVTVEEVNRRTWNYVKLHELVGGVEVGLPSPYHLVLGRDGCLALPLIDDFRADAAAVAFFNRCLAGLLVGGVYCEAVSADGLEFGSIIDWKYIRSQSSGQSASNRFHKHIRHLQAAPLEAIALYQPPVLSPWQMRSAMETGLGFLSNISFLSADLLLRGVTGIARRDWNTGLANLWIVVEQLVSHLWSREVLQPARLDGSGKKRREQLEDNRSWTTAIRLEVLYQKGVIELEELTILSTGRRARNLLSHDGTSPNEEAVNAVYQGLQSLVRATLPGQHVPLFDLDLSDHALSDPFVERKPIRIDEPQMWMAIPKLPGEAEIEREASELRRMTSEIEKDTRQSEADLG